MDGTLFSLPLLLHLVIITLFSEVVHGVSVTIRVLYEGLSAIDYPRIKHRLIEHIITATLRWLSVAANMVVYISIFFISVAFFQWLTGIQISVAISRTTVS